MSSWFLCQERVTITGEVRLSELYYFYRVLLFNSITSDCSENSAAIVPVWLFFVSRTRFRRN
jgi:hypothetical protein